MAEAIGVAILTAVGAEAVAATTVIGTVTVATIVGQAVITGGLIGLQFLLQQQNEATTLPTSAQGRQTLRQAVSARLAGYGRARIAGNFMLYEEREGDSYDAIALCEGPIGGPVLYYLHDDEVTLDASGDVIGVINSTTGSGDIENPKLPGPDDAKNDGRYIDHVTIQTRRGFFPEDAEDTFVGQLPDIWSDDHRGDGIASAYMQCRSTTRDDFEHIYPHGLPQLSIVADLLGCFDPRDPTQIRTDETTWKVTSNPILQLMRFLTDERLGMGLNFAETVEPVLSRWIDEADLCDLEGYRSNGFYRLDTDPAEVIGMLLATCDGWIAEDGEGRLVPVAGSYREPTFIIEEKHIVGLSLTLGVDDERAVNELKWTYVSPEHQYNEIAGDPWRDETDIEARGRVRAQSLSLSWVQDHEQGRKLCKRAMARLGASARGKLETTLYGLGALGRRWIGLRYPFLATLSDAVLEIENVEVDLAAGRVRFDWIKVDGVALTDFDPIEEGGTAPPVPPPSGAALVTDNAPEDLLDNDGEQILENA